MNTLDSKLYTLMELGLGGGSFQSFVDHYLEKYDALQTDGFTYAPASINYTWKQLLSDTKATTLPAYVSPESPGYEASLNEVRGLSGDIPTQKKFYRLNRVIVQEKLQMLQQFGDAALTDEMQEVFMGLLDESTDGLIKAYRNSLTNQRMSIASTGKFVIDINNNPRGLKGIEIDFGVEADHFDVLTGTARWWTDAERTKEGSASDPIQYIKNRLKFIRRTKHYYGPLHVEMDQKVYEDLLMHTKVLTRIGHVLYPNVSDAATVLANAQNATDEQIAQMLNRLCGITIVPKDSYSYVDVVNYDEHETQAQQVENFKHENIAFVPDGQWGTIQGVKPLTLGYDPDKVALFDGGRLTLTTRTNPETHSLYIESEAAQLCVPSNVRGLFISTVTA